MVVRTYLELQSSYRGVRHCTRSRIINRIDLSRNRTSSLPVARVKFEQPFQLASLVQGVSGILNFTRVTGQRMSSDPHRSIQQDLLHPSEAKIDAIRTCGSNKVRKTISTCVNIFKNSRYFELYSNYRADYELCCKQIDSKSSFASVWGRKPSRIAV